MFTFYFVIFHYLNLKLYNYLLTLHYLHLKLYFIAPPLKLYFVILHSLHFRLYLVTLHCLHLKLYFSTLFPTAFIRSHTPLTLQFILTLNSPSLCLSSLGFSLIEFDDSGPIALYNFAIVLIAERT